MKKRIAIITARGGSKRIPRKNIKEFCGKPIIAYSIDAALKSKLFDEVMVSTDDAEIANVAINYGAQVPFMRSKETSDDYADTEAVLLEVLNEYRKRSIETEEFCCIYPTAPFITEQKLKESYDLFCKKKCYTVVSMVQFSFPPQRGMKKEGSYVVPYQPKYINCRSQDLETIYHDCGQFYWCRTVEFLKQPALFSEYTIPYLVPDTEVQDIDNESDWELAEIKFQHMRAGRQYE